MQNSLGIITPDITRSLGFISPEAVRSLGLITPDITRSLGAQRIFVGPDPRLLPLIGVPWTTVAVVSGMSVAGSGIAGYAASRSAKGALLGAVGGLIGSATGLAVSGYLQKRALAKFLAPTVEA